MPPLNLPCPNCGKMSRVGAAEVTEDDGRMVIQGGVQHDCGDGTFITIVRFPGGNLVAFGAQT